MPAQGSGDNAYSYRTDLFQHGWLCTRPKGSSAPPGAPLSSGAMRTKRGSELPGASAAPECALSGTAREIIPFPAAPSFSLYNSLTLSEDPLPLTHTLTHTRIEVSQPYRLQHPLRGLRTGSCLTLKRALTITLLFLEHLCLIICS